MSPLTNMSKKLQFSMRLVARPKRRRTSKRRFLPWLDQMENRTLLSTLTVMNNQDSGAGSLRADIAAAKRGDTIAFAAGLRGQTIVLTTGELDITTSLNIDGPGASLLSVSGGGTSRVFDISPNATVTIGSLTITDGNTVGANGGGILVEGAAMPGEPSGTLSLNHVVMTNNHAMADSTGLDGGSGGGIENGGTLTVNACSFFNNVASLNSTNAGSQGGGIDSFGPSVTVTNSNFTGNQVDGVSTGPAYGTGGAINTDGSAATISNSTFIGNIALARTGQGGAICVEGPITGADFYNGNTAISNSTFSRNEAIGSNAANNIMYQDGGQADGGAFYTEESAAPTTITNSAFSNNLAKGGDQGNNNSGVADNGINGFVGLAVGGGICNQFASLTVTNSSFVGNQAQGGNSATGVGGLAGGGGIASAGFTTTTLTGVILEGNQAKGGSGGPGSLGGSSVGGGFYNGIDATATVSTSLFLSNRAVGGAGGLGAIGGAGEGGAFGNGGGFGDLVLAAHPGIGAEMSSLTLDQSTLIFNVAQGGNGGAGGNGGIGLGGGLFADPITTTAISSSWLEFNQATGGEGGLGGISGDGFGGGIDVTPGAGVSLTKTKVACNHAATSNNDTRGSVTYL